MKFDKFGDIIAWQKAAYFAVSIYSEFKNIRDYSFKDQIQRSALSVSNNIAEGFERSSNNEFTYFLYVSKGSTGESRSMLHIARRLNYIKEDTWKKLTADAMEISKLNSGIIKSIRSK